MLHMSKNHKKWHFHCVEGDFQSKLHCHGIENWDKKKKIIENFFKINSMLITEECNGNYDFNAYESLWFEVLEQKRSVCVSL